MNCPNLCIHSMYTEQLLCGTVGGELASGSHGPWFESRKNCIKIVAGKNLPEFSIKLSEIEGGGGAMASPRPPSRTLMTFH